MIYDALQNVAMQSFQLFLNQVQDAPEDLKAQILKVVFDILLLYDNELLRHSEDTVSALLLNAFPLHCG